MHPGSAIDSGGASASQNNFSRSVRRALEAMSTQVRIDLAKNRSEVQPKIKNPEKTRLEVTLEKVEKVLAEAKTKPEAEVKLKPATFIETKIKQESFQVAKSVQALEKAGFTQVETFKLVRLALKTQGFTETQIEQKLLVETKPETKTELQTEQVKKTEPEIPEQIQKQIEETVLRGWVKYLIRDEKALGQRLHDIEEAITKAYSIFSNVNGNTVLQFYPAEYSEVMSAIKPQGPDGSNSELRSKGGNLPEMDADQMENAWKTLAITIPPVALGDGGVGVKPEDVDRVLHGRREEILKLPIVRALIKAYQSEYIKIMGQTHRV